MQFVLLTGNSFIDLHYQTRIADIRDINVNLRGKQTKRYHAQCHIILLIISDHKLN